MNLLKENSFTFGIFLFFFYKHHQLTEKCLPFFRAKFVEGKKTGKYYTLQRGVLSEESGIFNEGKKSFEMGRTMYRKRINGKLPFILLLFEF